MVVNQIILRLYCTSLLCRVIFFCTTAFLQLRRLFDLFRICFASLATIRKNNSCRSATRDWLDRGSRIARNIAPRLRLHIYDGETSCDPVEHSRIRWLLRCKDYRVNWDACSLVVYTRVYTYVHNYQWTSMKHYLLAQSEKGED